jgi:hypothetical protein
MAAPHVTGTVAAMFEAAGRPVSIDEIRDCLKRSAEPVADDEHAHCCAWGRLNTAEAIRKIRGLTAPELVSAPQRSASAPDPWVMAPEPAISDAPTGDFASASDEQEMEVLLDEGALMNADAADRFLDRAEQALKQALRNSNVGRRQSETSFLQRLLRELGHGAPADLSPAGLFRAVLHNRTLTQDARNVLEILAMPSQQLKDVLRAGDWILRAVPGTGDVGHLSVLASGDLLTPSVFAAEGIAAESVQPGQYGLVIEAGAFPHSRSRPFARRLLDNRRRVLRHTMILRPKYPDMGAVADFPPDEPETNGAESAVVFEEFEEFVGCPIVDDIGAGERGAQAPVAEEDLEYEQILGQIRRELDLRFRDPNDPGLIRRRRRLRDLFTSVPGPRTKELHARLGARPTGDELSRLFHGRLATATRHELLKILEDRFPADTKPTPTTTKNPCQRGMGSMRPLLPWERSLLALVHDKSEADFKGVAVLIGPIILPGLMAWPLDAIVRTALQHNYAITIENNIWFPRAIDTSTVGDLAWLVHESVHVVDYAVAGTEAFLKSYIQQAIVHGFKHDDIPHEQRANRIEAAVKRMLARFPELVTAIGSCDGSAILELLQRRKDALHAALNESLGEEDVAAAPSGRRLDATGATARERRDDTRLREALVEQAPQARFRTVFYDRESLRYLDGWTRATGPSVVLLIDRPIYDTIRADGARRGRAFDQFLAQALAAAGRGRMDLMPPVFGFDPTLATVPLNRESRGDWDDLMIAQLIDASKRLTIQSERDQWTLINRLFANASTDAREAVQRQRAAREFAAYFVLDVIKATLALVEVTNVTMQDGHAIIPLGRVRGTDRRVVPGGDAAARVIGAIHTHYLFDPLIDLNRSSVGTTIRSSQTSLHSGVSDIDVASARNDHLVGYAVDSKYLHRANPNGTKNDKLSRSGDVLREALRVFGGEPGRSGASGGSALGRPEMVDAEDSAASGGGAGGAAAAGVVDPFPRPIIMSRDMFNVTFRNCIEAASRPADVNNLCGAVVDLTGNPDLPPYAGHKDTDNLYVGSIAKIYPLLAAFELRRRVTQQAKDMIKLGLSTAAAGWQDKVFAELKKGWQPQLDAAFPGLSRGSDHRRFPDLARIVRFSLDGNAELRDGNDEFLDWIRAALQQNDAVAAGKYIRALSYPYINGVLRAAGFFNPANKTGLWISGDYNGNDWLPADGAGQPLTPRWTLPGHPVSNFTGTAQQMVRFLGLMAQGKLIDKTASNAMISLLGAPFLKDTLYDATPVRPFTSADGKVGIGDWGGRYHDSAIVRVERGGDPARTISYAVAVLGSPNGVTALRKLELAYHDCIVARHP